MGTETISGIPFKETIFTDFPNTDILFEAQKVSKCPLLSTARWTVVVPCEEGKTIYKNIKKPKNVSSSRVAIIYFQILPIGIGQCALNWFQGYHEGLDSLPRANPEEMQDRICAIN